MFRIKTISITLFFWVACERSERKIPFLYFANCMVLFLSCCSIFFLTISVFGLVLWSNLWTNMKYDTYALNIKFYM